MFLKYLQIVSSGEIIRNIPFNKGINFIVDNTPYVGGKESGNNVGKTTVLRLIDYCLGSTGADIYLEKEFKGKQAVQVNEVKEYLISNNVSVELCIVDNLENPVDNLVISRNFLAGKQKSIKINGSEVTGTELSKTLNKELFDNPDLKPTFRNLIAKFIRDDTHKMSNTLKFLHQATSNVQYEAVHLYLFGIHLPEDLYGEKQRLTLQVASDEKVLNSLTAGMPENALIQALKIIERDIAELEYKKGLFNLNDVEDSDVNRFNNLKLNISKLSTRISNIQLRISLIEDALEDLRSGINKTDVEQIRQLYLNAKALIPELHTEFEQVVAFHNTMLEKKYSFISKDLQPLKAELTTLNSKLSQDISEEQTLASKIKVQINLEEYNQVIGELNRMYELKGSREERLGQITALKESITEKREKLDGIIEIMTNAESELTENETIFNKYFSKYSRELYDEEFFLTHVKDDKDSYKFIISNIQANIGGGKKKGQIAAFDLAYISFCEEKDIIAPRFVLHDSTEDVSITQLIKIAEISSNINGQYVLAILKDKFTSNKVGTTIVEENKILELSENDKLFKF